MSWPRWPKNAAAEVKADYWAIFDLPEGVEPGPDAVKMAQARIDAFATPLARLVSGRGAQPARRPRVADGLPAVSARALEPGAPLQLH